MSAIKTSETRKNGISFRSMYWTNFMTALLPYKINAQNGRNHGNQNIWNPYTQKGIKVYTGNQQLSQNQHSPIKHADNNSYKKSHGKPVVLTEQKGNWKGKALGIHSFTLLVEKSHCRLQEYYSQLGFVPKFTLCAFGTQYIKMELLA